MLLINWFRGKAHFAAIERFRVSTSGIAFQPAKPQHRAKRLVVEPWFDRLSWKTLDEQIAFCLSNRTGNREEDVWLPQISLVLRNFVFQYEMIPKRAPGQLGDYSMILMSIFSSVSEYQIWLDVPAESMESVLNLTPLCREIAVSKFKELNIVGPGSATEETVCTLTSFF